MLHSGSHYQHARRTRKLKQHTFAAFLSFSYLEGMEIQFNPDLQARLVQKAAQRGVDPNEVVQEVVARYFEEEDRFVGAVKRGEAALERGESLSHEQVAERLRRFLQP
jgi:predicted transcriptional regulator